MNQWIKKISIGQMRHKIIIETYAILSNDLNEEVITWSTLAEVWAKIDYKAGSEKHDEEREIVHDKILFITRYDSRFTDEKMRILYNSRVYDIETIENIEETNRFLQFTASIHR